MGGSAANAADHHAAVKQHLANHYDKFGVDGHRDLVAAGVTDYIGIPWVFEGLPFDAPVGEKIDSMKRFADTYIHSGWQDEV